MGVRLGSGSVLLLEPGEMSVSLRRCDGACYPIPRSAAVLSCNFPGSLRNISSQRAALAMPRGIVPSLFLPMLFITPCLMNFSWPCQLLTAEVHAWMLAGFLCAMLWQRQFLITMRNLRQRWNLQKSVSAAARSKPGRKWRETMVHSILVGQNVMHPERSCRNKAKRKKKKDATLISPFAVTVYTTQLAFDPFIFRLINH